MTLQLPIARINPRQRADLLLQNPDVRGALAEISRLESGDRPNVITGDHVLEDYDQWLHPWDVLGSEQPDLFPLQPDGKRSTAYGLYQINRPTFGDFYGYADPREPAFSEMNQHRMAAGILESTGAIRADGTLDPNWREKAAGRWKVFQKEEGDTMAPLDLPKKVGSFEIPEARQQAPSSVDFDLQPDPAVLELSEQLASVSADFESADEILRSFSETDSAPQVPIPPAPAQSFLGALFRGLGGEQAVQNDAQNIANAMTMIHQAALANQKQKGYKRMRDADIARARADLESSEVMSAIEARRESLRTRISEHQRVSTTENAAKVEKMLIDYERSLQDNFGEFHNENDALIRQDVKNALRDLTMRFAYETEPKELDDGTLANLVKEDQYITDAEGNLIANRRGDAAEELLTSEVDQIKEDVVSRLQPYLESPAAQRVLAGYLATIDREVQSLRYQRKLSDALWEVRYNPAENPNAPNRIVEWLRGSDAAWGREDAAADRRKSAAGGIMGLGDIPRDPSAPQRRLRFPTTDPPTERSGPGTRASQAGLDIVRQTRDIQGPPLDLPSVRGARPSISGVPTGFSDVGNLAPAEENILRMERAERQVEAISDLIGRSLTAGVSDPITAAPDITTTRRPTDREVDNPPLRGIPVPSDVHGVQSVPNVTNSVVEAIRSGKIRLPATVNSTDDADIALNRRWLIQRLQNTGYDQSMSERIADEVMRRF